MALLINTTFVIDGGVKASFFRWLQDCFIGEAMSRGAYDVVVSRIIGPEPDATAADEAESYACQFKMASPEGACAWRDHLYATLIPLCIKEWEQRVMPFTTFMDIIEEMPDA